MTSFYNYLVGKKIDVDTMVEAYSKKNGDWYPATITSVNGDGTYNVDYGNNNKDENFRRFQ